ncbi:MAG TPA: transposase [Rhizomicrobium sp.]|nr:transposase [Rhizomicrobium sp.]
MSNDVRARAPRPHRGWHERGYVPHFDAGAVVQAVSFRLADSLPREFYEKAAAVAANDIERAVLLERGIDQGRGNCILSDPKNAEIVRGVLQHFDGERYRLLAWVVMPNHVHAMIEQMEGYSLTGVLHSWKSYSAHAINKARASGRQVWSPDYFDRYVRDEDHYAHVKY